MLKNKNGFSLIESLIALFMMSVLMSLLIAQMKSMNVEYVMLNHQTHAYHILDNVLMEMKYGSIMNDEHGFQFVYDDTYQKQQEGHYLVIYDQHTQSINIYLKETMKEVIQYAYME